MGVWALAWLGGSLVLALPFVVAFDIPEGGSFSIPQLGVLALVSWAAFILALVVVSRRAGTGDFTTDFAVSARWVDLAAAPAGVFAQLAVVPALYWPLQQWWPDTFSDAKLEERAVELVDRAGGVNTVLLALVVVVGAPIVEELVYRGLIQRSLATVVPKWPALLLAAIWFAAIHLAPVETPGLFVAGLLFGGCVTLTGRLGPAMVAHAAFNAAGLLMAFGKA
jgi:membrane protease YdiL (CAAX protease family)